MVRTHVGERNTSCSYSSVGQSYGFTRRESLVRVQVRALSAGDFDEEVVYGEDSTAGLGVLWFKAGTSRLRQSREGFDSLASINGK